METREALLDGAVCSCSRIPLPSHHSPIFILQLLLEALACEELHRLHGLALFQFQETLSAKNQRSSWQARKQYSFASFFAVFASQKVQFSKTVVAEFRQITDYKIMGQFLQKQLYIIMNHIFFLTYLHIFQRTSTFLWVCMLTTDR